MYGKIVDSRLIRLSRRCKIGGTWYDSDSDDPVVAAWREANGWAEVVDCHCTDLGPLECECFDRYEASADGRTVYRRFAKHDICEECVTARDIAKTMKDRSVDRMTNSQKTAILQRIVDCLAKTAPVVLLLLANTAFSAGLTVDVRKATVGDLTNYDEIPTNVTVTVPAWMKSDTNPSYTKSETDAKYLLKNGGRYVSSVNGQTGSVTIDVPPEKNVHFLVGEQTTYYNGNYVHRALQGDGYFGYAVTAPDVSGVHVYTVSYDDPVSVYLNSVDIFDYTLADVRFYGTRTSYVSNYDYANDRYNLLSVCCAPDSGNFFPVTLYLEKAVSAYSWSAVTKFSGAMPSGYGTYSFYLDGTYYYCSDFIVTEVADGSVTVSYTYVTSAGGDPVRAVLEFGLSDENSYNPMMYSYSLVYMGSGTDPTVVNSSMLQSEVSSQVTAQSTGLYNRMSEIEGRILRQAFTHMYYDSVQDVTWEIKVVDGCFLTEVVTNGDYRAGN